MKKLFMMMLMAATLSQASAQTQVLNIYTGENLETDLDGRDDDPVWEKVEKVPLTRVFQSETPTVEAYFKMFYTDDFLYVYVDVTDDVHFPAWVGKADNERIQDVQHMFDKAELYFNVNENLKGGKGPVYDNGYMAPGYYQVAPYFEESSYDEPYLLTGLLYGDLSDQIMVCYTLKDDYKSYSMEFEIPLEKFKDDKGEFMSKDKFLALADGMGFDMTIVDNDNDGLLRKRLVWNSSAQEAYYNMDDAGVVKFVDLPVGSGISQVSLDNGQPAAVWSLQGIRKEGSKLSRGLYISGGKKVIIR